MKVRLLNNCSVYELVTTATGLAEHSATGGSGSVLGQNKFQVWILSGTGSTDSVLVPELATEKQQSNRAAVPVPSVPFLPSLNDTNSSF